MHHHVCPSPLPSKEIVPKDHRDIEVESHSPGAWAPMGSLEPGAKRESPSSLPAPLFPAYSPHAPTHCFLLTMKNRDLFGSVLIDSKGMDLPKQKISLTKNILCHLRKVKLERPFAISKAWSQLLSPSITHSFI